MVVPQWYLAALRAQPFRVNIATAGFVMAMGDTLAQGLEANTNGRPFELDKIRSAKMISWSVLGFVPINFFSYRTIERVLPDRVPQSMARSAFKGIVAFLPATVINPIFFAYTAALEACLEARSKQQRVDTDQIRRTVERRYREDLVGVLQASAYTWLPVNIVNFCLMPPAYRIIVTSTVSTVWNGYLSLVNHKH